VSTGLLAAASSPVLWYVARASGAIALVLLTLSVVGGIVTSVRWSSERLPRFVTQLLHRNVSLLALVLIGIHIATIVIDGFAPIGWIDTVVPFRSGYRPFWLGLGAIALDLVLALIVTSLLRHRIGQRTWRVVHWSAYACWPLVVLHGLGAGSDTKSGVMLVTTVACIVLVVVAIWWRLASGWPDHAGVRVASVAATLVAPFLLAAWLADGPLASGWAARAGTPASLLGASPSVEATTAGAPAGTAAPFPDPPFTSTLSGALTTVPARDGTVTLNLSLAMSGTVPGDLEIAVTGQPRRGGGVFMESSRVRMGSDARSLSYDGRITNLNGDTLTATVRDAQGRSLELTADLRVVGDRRLTGRLRVDPAPRTSTSSEQRRGEESGERGERG
jgi:Ferric reductase like transmembrane component